MLRLEDLNLKIGQVVQIHPHPDALKERFDCVLVGCLPGESILLSAPPEGVFPVLEEGQQVVIRVMSSNGVALFSTTVLFISDMPVFMVYLDFPHAINFKIIRNASRVEVALPIIASNRTTMKQSGIAGRVLDISTTGARLELFSDIGNIGDKIELKGKFDVADIQRVLSVMAKLKSRHASAKTFIYGIEFDEADEEKLIILFGFIFNALAFGKIQTIR